MQIHEILAERLLDTIKVGYAQKDVPIEMNPSYSELIRVITTTASWNKAARFLLYKDSDLLLVWDAALATHGNILQWMETNKQALSSINNNGPFIGGSIRKSNQSDHIPDQSWFIYFLDHVSSDAAAIINASPHFLRMVRNQKMNIDS